MGFDQYELITYSNLSSGCRSWRQVAVWRRGGPVMGKDLKLRLACQFTCLLQPIFLIYSKIILFISSKIIKIIDTHTPRSKQSYRTIFTRALRRLGNAFSRRSQKQKSSKEIKMLMSVEIQLTLIGLDHVDIVALVAEIRGRYLTQEGVYHTSTISN